MFPVRVIPCLDVKDGRVVKGVNFVDLRDAGDPVEAARAYDAAGADELCFLDITASHENRDTILDIVQRTAEQCFMPLTVGGGVRKVEDVRRLLQAGADKVSINTAAVRDPDFVARAADVFGAQCIVVAIDAKAVEHGEDGTPKRWEIFTHGGREPTGIDAIAFAQKVTALGAGEILLTSMDRDGTRSGFDIALTRCVSDAVSVPVIASGGVGTLDHLVAGAREGGAGAVLAASIFHFGDHTIAEAKATMAAAGIPVRPVSANVGPAAHGRSGAAAPDPLHVLVDLERTIAARVGADPSSSYTAKLLAAGPAKCAKKAGEEGVEFALAVAGEPAEAVRAEAADVLYHMLVALCARGVPFEAVCEALRARVGTSGLVEKAARGN